MASEGKIVIVGNSELRVHPSSLQSTVYVHSHFKLALLILRHFS